ncbi:MarR family winged helix-turn-helix transcriptional regulator [Stutzerimonas chloritidismutans]|uniref:MarR family winged helix-turn-helix transcriptional regulator n=1 Tax=Stutzerimonas chloritidismutans TaxID=203192 RepID=UPI003F18DEE7
MTDRLAEAVFESIHTIMHLYRARQYRALRGGPHDLSHMANKVLGFFAAHPGATLRELVQRSGRDKAQLARLIKELRDRELLFGEVDETDRRSVRLRLTAQGEAVHKALRQQAQQLNKVAVQDLSEEEQQALIDLLGRVRSSLSG